METGTYKIKFSKLKMNSEVSSEEIKDISKALNGDRDYAPFIVIGDTMYEVVKG